MGKFNALSDAEILMSRVKGIVFTLPFTIVDVIVISYFISW